CRMQGIVQVQVQEKAGLTFAAALRSILRQDPNVVLVGEIRDRETAQIAVQASLTGHLVLSTLHTNDAANAVTRLVDIGVEAYKIAGAARRAGMKGLWDSGLEHVLRGESTLDELTRIVDIPQEDEHPPDAAAAAGRRSTGGGKPYPASHGATAGFPDSAYTATPEELTAHFELLEEPEP